MKLEYKLSLADFRELSAAMNPVPLGQNAVVQLVIWLFLFLLLLANVFLGGLESASQSRGGSRAVAELPLQNVWVLLAPHLLIATALLITIVSSPLRSNTLQARSKSHARTLRVAGIVSLLCFVWLIPVLTPTLAIHWRPTEGQLIWASFTPWSLYFAAVRPIIALRRKRLIDSSWASLPSLHRANVVVISRNGIDATNGLVTHQYQWACFKRYRETSHLLLLLSIDDLPVAVLPKRAVANEKGMDELKMLISENIPDGQFLRKPQAFPVIMPGVGS